MPSDSDNRSKATKRPYKSEDDEDVKKRKRTEKNDTGTGKNSEASTSGTKKLSNKERNKTPAFSRLQQLKEKIKKDVLKIGNKESLETTQSSGGTKRPRARATKREGPKQDSNSPSSESEGNSPKKMCRLENISGKRVPSHVPDLKRKSKTPEAPPDQKKNKDNTASQSPMNQRMLKIRKTLSSSVSSLKTKIVNVSDKIQAGEMNSLVNISPNKSFKIPLKKNLPHTETFDSPKDTATRGDSEVKTKHLNETPKETISPTYQTNIFATNNNDKASPNKMQPKTPTFNTNIFASNKIESPPVKNISPLNTNIFASNNIKNVMESPALKPTSTFTTNIFASNNIKDVIETPNLKPTLTDIFASNKINEIKSPEFNFESKRSSSPKEHVQSKNANIFARESLGDFNETNSDVDCSLEIIEEITSPCAFKTPISTKTVGNKSNSIGDRMKKIRGQLQNAEANKSVDNDFGFVSQMSFEELYKNSQPSCSRTTVVQNWMESIQPTPNLSDQSASDSMLVNFDNTLLEKSELLAVSREDNSMEWDSIPDVPPSRFPTDSSSIEENHKDKSICVVADTNIFMHDLERLDTILNLKLPGDKKLIIYVPWMVLGELDNLKEARSNIFKTFATQKALKGQRFINKHLAQSNSKIICQSVNEVCQQLDLGKSPDDKILACCLQVQNKYETVILLTGDINLRNKALANQVKSYPPSEIVERLENSKFFKIKVLCQEVLSDVISRCCWNVYGEAIHRMNALQVGRWGFEDCIARLKQYWQPVFSQLLLKHCLKTIEELAKLSRKGSEIETNPKEFMNFVNKVKELLFYLQDIDYFNSVVKQLRDNIDEIVKAPKEF
ncbi:unnamed protein product [Ceutorhynchus assimilis]|uniref:PIN domain-containing protein n=1 Tax=Ceutorhynchus assimilis TaxID=467358 RepID=A0A9P0GRD6_9CUCU|nr:unnamed protein product [Ceutorhynchus assimilis]